MAEFGGGRGTSGRCPETVSSAIPESDGGCAELAWPGRDSTLTGASYRRRASFLSSLSREPGGRLHELMLGVERKPDSQ